MGTLTTAKSGKKGLSKAAIIKIAEDSAKKTAKKAAEKVATEKATKVAAKVGAQAALNPDYDTEDFNNEYEDDEEEESSGAFTSLLTKSDDEDDDFDFDSSSSHRKSEDYDDDEDDLASSVKNPDIFAYGEDLMKKGTPIRFQIKKNGQFLTTIRKPYSEDQLQKDHGEGHYTVILRNDSKGTFIKQQSFAIAAPPQTIVEEKEKMIIQKQEEKIDRMFETFSEMQQRMQESQSQLVEKLLAEQREREEKEEERRREERELLKEQEMANNNLLATVLQASLSKKDDGGITSVIQMMQQQQNQTTQLIMEMQKNSMMMIQEMRRDTQSMMEKITNMTQQQAQEFRQQIAEMANKKQDGFDPVTMFKMLQDTRESGFNFGLKLQQMAKEMASEMDAPPPQPKGIVESVLDNFGKLAPILLAQNNTPKALPVASQPAVPQRPALVAAPPAPSYKSPKPVMAAKPVTTVQKPVTTVQKPVTTVQKPVASVTATPVTTDAKTTPQKPVVKKTTTKQTPQISGTVATNQESAKIAQDAQLKETIIGVCVPLIGTALQTSESSGKLGENTIAALAQQGISVQTAVKLVSVEDIYDLAFKRYSLPELPELRAYLKDYHDYLKQKASA
jgi:hypothetical protein